MNLISDFRVAFRVLRKNPGFTVTTILVLALGIGANTVVFTGFNRVLLHPLSYPDPDRLVTLWDAFPEYGIAKFGLTYANAMEVKQRNHVFATYGPYAAASNTSFNVGTTVGPERVQGTQATADFFRAIGVPPLLGRVLEREDELPARNHVVVIGYGLWQRACSGDARAIGRNLRLNDEDYEIVGVMPPGFEFPSGAEMPAGQQFAGAAEIWTPLTIPTTPGPRNDRTSHYLRAIARLAPGVSVAQARAELAALTARLVQEHPVENQGLASTLTTVRENQVGRFRPAFVVLLAAVAFVLLIACANLANLLLARASAREKEFTIRAALGASRTRIIRQLLTESFLLSLGGGALGLALAFAGTRALVAFAPADIPRLSEVTLDGRALLFTLGLSLLTGLLFGLAPALSAARTDLNTGLKESGRGISADARQHRFRNMLVVGEVMLVFVLLVAAGLLLKSFYHLLSVAPGFDAADALAARITLPAQAYPPARKVQFYQQLLDRLADESPVTAVGMIRDLPLSGTDPRYGFSVAGRPVDPDKNAYTYRYRVISPGYFAAMGIRLLRGRAFTEHDDATCPGVAVINATAARRAFPGQDPVGQVILTGGSNAPAKCTVIGVVDDVKFGGLDTKGDIEVYYNYRQLPGAFMNGAIGSMALVVRGGDDAGLAAIVRRNVAKLDPDIPVSSVQRMTDIVAGSLAARRYNLLLLGAFAASALLLAAVGIFGVISSWVAQRIREFGIRVALGATRADILRLVLRRTLVIVTIGLSLGVLGAIFIELSAQALIYGVLFGVAGFEPGIFCGVGILLIVVAALASYLPARRATRVDPTVALRYE